MVMHDLNMHQTSVRECKTMMIEEQGHGCYEVCRRCYEERKRLRLKPVSRIV